jgi:hypothetical protein
MVLTLAIGAINTIIKAYNSIPLLPDIGDIGADYLCSTIGIFKVSKSVKNDQISRALPTAES